MPTTCHALTWVRDPGFRDAIARYLDAEREAVAEEVEILTEYGPFRNTTQEEDHD